MRTYFGSCLILGGLAAIMAYNGQLRGADPNVKGDTADGAPAAGSDDGGAKKKDRAVGGKDPVAAAFALPKGVTLNPTQQSAYDDLKQKYEEQLLQAFDDVQHADDAASTSRALKEVRETKTKIKAGLQEILAMPYRAAAEKADPQPASGGSAGGAYVPVYGEPGGYYPGGYYPGGYYPGYYPSRDGRYHKHDSKSSSGSTKTGTSTAGSNTTAGKYPGNTQSTSKPAPKPAPKPVPKPAPQPTTKH